MAVLRARPRAVRLAPRQLAPDTRGMVPVAYHDARLSTLTMRTTCAYAWLTRRRYTESEATPGDAGRGRTVACPSSCCQDLAEWLDVQRAHGSLSAQKVRTRETGAVTSCDCHVRAGIASLTHSICFTRLAGPAAGRGHAFLARAGLPLLRLRPRARGCGCRAAALALGHHVLDPKPAVQVRHTRVPEDNADRKNASFRR